jgi:hypothetical protein
MSEAISDGRSLPVEFQSSLGERLPPLCGLTILGTNSRESALGSNSNRLRGQTCNTASLFG